jgi:putative DNA primase/helicase
MTASLIDRAEGRWRDILILNGIPESFLTGKHGPCPFCGGRDRFRWTNVKDTGCYFCNQCGPGWGSHFLMKWHKCGYPEAFKMIEAVLGESRRQLTKPPPSESKTFDQVKQIWGASIPIDATILTDAEDDTVRKYLKARDIDPAALAIGDLRQSTHGNMIAIMRDPRGFPVQMQATLLTRDGDKRKDKHDRSRLFLRGHIPDGTCVRLMKVGPDHRSLGIAEGIETALSAALLFGMPVWASLNSALLKKWMPPIGVPDHITIFGDADDNYAGQAAAYQLAHTLCIKYKKSVTVAIPRASIGWDRDSYDWNDDWRIKASRTDGRAKEVATQETRQHVPGSGDGQAASV